MGIVVTVNAGAELKSQVIYAGVVTSAAYAISDTELKLWIGGNLLAQTLNMEVVEGLRQCADTIRDKPAVVNTTGEVERAVALFGAATDHNFNIAYAQGSGYTLPSEDSVSVALGALWRPSPGGGSITTAFKRALETYLEQFAKKAA